MSAREPPEAGARLRSSQQRPFFLLPWPALRLLVLRTNCPTAFYAIWHMLDMKSAGLGLPSRDGLRRTMASHGHLVRDFIAFEGMRTRSSPGLPLGRRPVVVPPSAQDVNR